MLNTVYFAKDGEKGLNETSASHLCALASQLKANAEKALESICFVDTTMNVVGAAGGPMQCGTGISSEEFHKIESNLQLLAKMNAFISWFSEARKNLEDYKKERNHLTLEEWAHELGTTLPTPPTSKASEVKSSTLEDIIAQMDVKEREEYLAIEAKSAVYGKFIHPNRSMEAARDNLHYYVACPFETTGSGRDTLVKHRTPSVPVKDVDDLFIHLQKVYRQTEQSLNHMKSDLRKRLEKANLEENNQRRLLNEEYRSAFREYQAVMSEITIQFNSWMVEENTRLSKIKFIIPDALAETVKMLNNLDKE